MASDTLTLLFTIILLLFVGYTLYRYAVTGVVSRYSPVIIVLGVLSLLFLTRSTENERLADAGESLWSGLTSPFAPAPRRFRYGGGKKRN
jgi:hypothetical protein